MKKTGILKKINTVALVIFFSIFTAAVNAQNKASIGVISIETNGINQSAVQTGNLVRLELEKLDEFTVVDKYDVVSTLKNANINIDSCNGKSCLVQAGKFLKADKMIGGSVDRYGNKVVIALRLIDVKRDVIEKTQISEYRNFQDNLQDMVSLSLHKLFSLPVDKALEDVLSNPAEYETQLNNPGAEKLVLNGPRIGLTFITGENGKRISADRDNGGWEGYPFMTIFGYQHEVQYLNEGDFQALFEFIPVVAGLDQNLFNPSFSILNGFRNNRNGWEFALGPNFSMAPMAKGYYNAENKWVYLGNENAPEGFKSVTRLDRRGTMEFNTSFIFAVGKSFRSGRLNIPLNMYVMPGRDGWRAGVSFGFNAKKREIR